MVVLSLTQYHAVRVITYYGPGPRIAHTPKDSMLHPDKLLHKKAIVERSVPVSWLRPERVLLRAADDALL